MRPPRHRFSDEVRTTTRSIALRMVRDDAVARTPDELDSWIGANPEARQTLEHDGYGSAFNADDLFPLLQGYVVKAGGRIRQSVASPGGVRPGWVAIGALVVAVVVGVVIGILA